MSHVQRLLQVAALGLVLPLLLSCRTLPVPGNTGQALLVFRTVYSDAASVGSRGISFGGRFILERDAGSVTRDFPVYSGLRWILVPPGRYTGAQVQAIIADSNPRSGINGRIAGETRASWPALQVDAGSFAILPGAFDVATVSLGENRWTHRVAWRSLSASELAAISSELSQYGNYSAWKTGAAAGAPAVATQPAPAKPAEAAPAPQAEKVGAAASPPEAKTDTAAPRSGTGASEAGEVVGELPVAAVLDFRVQNMAESDAMLIVDLLGSALIETRRYRVIDRSQRQNLLEEIEFSQSDCSDERCQLEIGRMLASDFIVIGSLGKVGDRFILNIKLLRVETAEAMSTAYRVFATLNELVDGTEDIARALSK